MKFWGGFLKFWAVLILLLATVGCTIVIVMEGVVNGYEEAIWVMSGVWVLCLILFSFFWSVGVALSNVVKLKKKVEVLEQKIQNLSIPQPIAVQPAATVPATEAEKAYVAPAVPTVEPTAAEAARFVSYDDPSAQPAKKKLSKKTLIIAIAAVVVVALVIVILVSGGKDKPQQNADFPNNDPIVEQPHDDIPEEPPQEEDNSEDSMDAVTLSCGDKIVHESFEMTLDSIEMMDEFSYDTSEYSSTSLYVEEGYKLLMLRGHFTNTGTSTIQEHVFVRTATVNDSYVVEDYDVRMNFLRSNQFEIDAYTDMDYVIYINIPEKLAEMFETVTFTFGFKDDLSTVTTSWNSDGTKTTDINQLYAITGGLGSSGNQSVSAEGEAPSEAEAATPISIGETVVCSDYEFTLTDMELTYELLPPNTSSVYTSYAAESGKVYVHVGADVKNTMQRDIRIDELFTASAIYDGKYPYTGFTIVNDGDNSFDWVSSYVAATPLETCKAHSLIECPVEVDESGKPVTVLITIGDTTYQYPLR